MFVDAFKAGHCLLSSHAESMSLGNVTSPFCYDLFRGGKYREIVVGWEPRGPTKHGVHMTKIRVSEIPPSLNTDLLASTISIWGNMKALGF